MSDKKLLTRLATIFVLMLALTAATLPAVAAPAADADRGADTRLTAAWDLLADGWDAVVSLFTVGDGDDAVVPSGDPQTTSTDSSGGDDDNYGGQMDPNG